MRLNISLNDTSFSKSSPTKSQIVVETVKEQNVPKARVSNDLQAL